MHLTLVGISPGHDDARLERDCAELVFEDHAFHQTLAYIAAFNPAGPADVDQVREQLKVGELVIWRHRRMGVGAALGLDDRGQGPTVRGTSRARD